MAKTIKFNLIINDQPVRSIEDLRNNFCVEDVLSTYRNGLLQKWLFVRGYIEELEKVNAISSKSDIAIIKQLINIFEMNIAENKIDEDIYILRYKDERVIELAEFEKRNFQANEIIDDYHNGYNALIMDIVNNKHDMSKIKANINEICENYFELFVLHYPIVFDEVRNAPLAVFAMLMREEFRPYLIHSSLDSSIPENVFIKRNYGHIIELTKLITNPMTRPKIELFDELHITKGVTDGYWKDIKSKGKKYLIISMQDGGFMKNYVRNAGVTGEELTASDINNNFVILDGIDYKSNSENDELLYMEV